MARKKGTRIGEKAREGLSDGRYKDAGDYRIQLRRLEKNSKKFRDLTSPK